MDERRDSIPEEPEHHNQSPKTDDSSEESPMSNSNTPAKNKISFANDGET